MTAKELVTEIQIKILTLSVQIAALQSASEQTDSLKLRVEE